MEERIRAIHCPSCGAPVNLPQDSGQFFTCQFCGTTLEDQTTPQEREAGSLPRLVIRELELAAHPPQAIPEITISPIAVKLAKRGIGFMVILFALSGLFGLLVVMFFVWVALSGQPSFLSGVFKETIYSYGIVHILPGETGSQPDIYAVARYPEDVSRMVYLDFDSRPVTRWTSDPLGDGADYVLNASTYNQTHIFLAYETNLAAFDRADGSIPWLSELSDQVSNICHDCLQVFGSRLVILTDDGNLSAFDTLTGKPAWKVRLNATPRWLENLAGKVVVLDEDDDGVGINIYQPENGERLLRIMPHCFNTISRDSSQSFGIYDPVFITSDGQKMLIPIYRYDPGCIQTWEGSSLTQVGEIPIPRNILRLSINGYLFTDAALYLAEGNQLISINLMDGSYATVYSDPDYEFYPIDAQASTLVMLANRRRGTSRYDLRGIQPGSEAAPWLFEFTAEERLETGVSLVDDQGLWYVAASPDKILVLEAYSNPSFADLTVLNLQDGSPLVSNSLQFDKDGADYWFQIPGWTQDRLYLVTDNQIRIIDITTGTQLTVWP